MRKLFAIFLTLAILVGVAVPVFAVEYVESPGKTIIIQGDEELMLVTTPIECLDDALHAEIEKMLARAWAQIYAAGTIADLTPEVIPELERIKAESDDPLVKALTIEDFVVCDVFDVSLIKNKTEFVHSTPGQPLTFSVKTALRPGDVFMILHNPEGTNWELLKRWDLSDDGVLLVAVDSLSPFAIAVPDYYGLTVDYTVVSPQTGDHAADTGVLSAIVVICASAALACGAVFIRKRHVA